MEGGISVDDVCCGELSLKYPTSRINSVNGSRPLRLISHNVFPHRLRALCGRRQVHILTFEPFLINRTQDFCLIPIGTGPDPSVSLTASSLAHTPTYHQQVAEYIAECARILDKSGLKYQVCATSL